MAIRKTFAPQPNEFCEEDCIPIVPNASIDYQATLQLISKGSTVMICETGGKLAHLATLGREYDCLILQLTDASKRFPEGSLIRIDMNSLTITQEIL